jgi:DNA-directed RNA polymerase specialized sigma24 family protein
MALSAAAARPVLSPQDARRFETLLVEHRPRVYRFAYRLTGSRLDAEDLAPDAELRTARQIPDGHANPESTVLERVLDERIEQALNKLPDSFRRAVWMADVEGMTYEEIASAMRCSTGTVRSRIHRGRSQLQRTLASLRALIQTAAILLAPAMVSAIEM